MQRQEMLVAELTIASRMLSRVLAIAMHTRVGTEFRRSLQGRNFPAAVSLGRQLPPYDSWG